jgi:hypothetical protein
VRTMNRAVRTPASLCVSSWHWLAALSCAALVMALFTSSVHASECAGVRMPDRIAINETKLVLNGMGLRRATIFSVHIYVGGLYLEKLSHRADQVLSTAMAKRLVLRFVRDVDRGEMAGAIEDGISKNAGNKAESARKQVAAFTRLLPPLQKGKDLVFTYLPGKGLEIATDTRVLGVHKDALFAQLFFRIWFGHQPPDEKLKAGMLGAKCE